MSFKPQPLEGTFAEVSDLLSLRAVRLPRREGSVDVRAATAGNRLTRLRGRGIDFAEVRLYQPGDDVRAIDWRVTARKAKVHTKVYREERERPTIVAVDQRQTMYFGSRVRLKSVAAAEVAALLAWHAVDAADRVGGLVFRDELDTLFRPRRHPRAVVRLLGVVAESSRALAEAEYGSATPASESLNRALDHLLRAARTGYRVYLVSDFAGLDARAAHRLTRLGRHNSIVAIHVFDRLETELPPPDRYAVRHGVERVELDTSDEAVRTRYAERFATQRTRIEDACRTARAQLVPLATHEASVDRLTERLVH